MKKTLILTASLLFIFLCSSFCFSEEPKVSISGKFVRTSASGLPLTDIQVKVTGTKEITIKTDRNGNYIAYNLPAGGNYTITPFKAGFIFSPQTKIYTNLTASKINENFAVSERTYSISGKIIVGGKPSKGEVVMINTRAVKYFTNDDGEYFIDNLPYEGPYVVTVESNKFVFEPFKIEQLDKDIVYNFEKSIKARGYVTSFGMGIANVEIAVNNKRYKTDSTGFYEISGLAANGSYILAVINTEMNPDPKFVELKKMTQDKDNVNFSLSGSVSGTILMNNKPFVGAVVKVTSNDQSEETKTDKNGNYKINNLGLYRDYTVSVSSSGYVFAPNDRTIKKLAGQSESQNFTASIQKYKIYGTVMTGKTPARDVEVSVDGFSKFIKTDTNGTYSFDDLLYGKDYTVSVRSKQMKFIESKKSIKNISENMEVNFKGLLSISGKVTISGQPLENAKILYDFKSFVLTDKDGNYTVKDLMPNQVYTIEVSSDNYEFTPSSFTTEQLEDSLADKNFIVVIDPKIKKLAEEEAKKKILEEEKLRKEELKKIALQEKLAQEELKKKTLEEERLRKEELKRIEIQQQEQDRLRQEELKRIALQEKLAQEEAKQKALEQETLKKIDSPEKSAGENTVSTIGKDKDELQIIALQEKIAREEAKKKALEQEKSRKEELKKIALQEKIAQEEAKKKALEQEKSRKEELKKIALQEKIAQEEAKKKALEEEKLRKEELEKIALQEKSANDELKNKGIKDKAIGIESIDKDELQIIALQEEFAKEDAKKKVREEERLRKEEIKKIALQEKIAREDAKKKAREEERLRKEEIKKIALQEKMAQEEAKKKALEEEKLRKEELRKIAMQEKMAQEEAKQKALEQETLKKIDSHEKSAGVNIVSKISKDKDELQIIALQEKIAREDAKKKAREEEKLRKEELRQIALQEKLAQKEAKRKALEQEKARKEELKRIELNEKINQEQKKRLEMQAKIALQEKELQEKELQEENLQKKELQNKIEEEKVKNRELEQERLRKEELERIAIQQQEQDRLRQEELKKIELQSKLNREQEIRAEEAKQKALEEERLRKEDQKKIDEQKKEQQRLEKEEAEKKEIEAKLRKEELKKIALQEKLAQEEAKKKAREEERLRKEELKRIEREEKELEKERKKKLRTKAIEEKNIKKESQADIEVFKDVNEKTFTVSGRILKGRYGVARIPVKLLHNGSSNVFLTDKYGYYSIPDLEKDRDYVVTIVSDDNVLNISPKSRVYKNVNQDFTNHNYYVVTEK